MCDDALRQAAPRRRANIESLGHAGAAIWLTANRSIRKREGPSTPGKPPHTRRGQLRSAILYAVERQRESVVIGPEGLAAAQDALMEELLDFFQRLQRTDIAEMVKTQQALIRAGIAAAEQKLGTLDVQKAVAEILGEACTNLPGSSESTPAP